MKIDLPVAALGIAASFVVSACGGSSGGSCSNTPACGGDIVGTWTVTSSCVSPNAAVSAMDCPSATVRGSVFTVTGSVTYKADMTYSQTGTLSGSATVVLPPSCVTLAGVPVTCDELDQLIQSQPKPGLTIHCSGSSSCSCSETATNLDSSESGTYTITAAGVLTETPTGKNATITASDYCVTGTTLTESPHSGGTITLTKS